jgi:hypothetical protein
MKHIWILLMLAIMVGAIGGSLLFLSLTNYPDSDRIQPSPLFIVRNIDLNQTHSVEVQIANMSGMVLFGRIYNLGPGNRTMSDIPAPDHNLDVFFHVLVDGHNESEMLVNMSPTHIAVIEIGSPNGPYPVSFSVIDVTPKKDR